VLDGGWAKLSIFMHTHPQFRKKALLYRGLANERRLSILILLQQHPQTGVELVRYLKIRPSCVTKHLRILMTARLVYGKRNKGSVQFYVVDGVVRRFLS